MRFTLFKTLPSAVLILVFSLGLFAGCSSLGRVDLRDTPIDVVDYRPKKPDIWTLPNGLSVYYVQDQELPLVQGKLYMRGGGLWEPETSAGFVSAMGSQLRLGGAGKYSPAQLDLELEKLAASVGSSFGQEYGAVSFRCLEQDLEHVFDLFSDVVLNPRFDESRLALWKSTALDSIRRRKDDAESISGLSLSQILYEGTPYGRVSVSSDIKKIERLDLLRVHRRFVRPNGAMLVVSGSAGRERIENLVKAKFASWEPRQDELGDPPPVTTVPKRGIYFIKKPVSQSSISIGQLGVKRHSKDQYAISVFNSVLGKGGFDSRLMKRVRTELGYVYGIYGATNPGIIRGTNFIGMQTKAESTVNALVESLQVVAELQANPPTPEEVKAVQQSIQSSFVFRFDSPVKSATRHALLELFGYPEDFDEHYLKHIFAVDRTQVQEVAQNRWRMDDFVIVVVGNEKAYNLIISSLQNPPDVLQGYEFINGSFYEKFERS